MISGLAPLQTVPNQEAVRSESEQQGLWRDRVVIPIPSSHTEEPNKNQSIGGALCCCVAICCTIAGGVMWGVCNDVSTQGCNVAIRTAGQALVGVGAGIIGLEICCVAAVCCCGAGILLASKD
jgi:hypothetical protein